MAGADQKVELQAVALEDLVVDAVGERQLLIEEIEIAIGRHRMASDVPELDLLAIARFLAHQHGNIDAAAVIALDQVFLPVTVSDHAEEIAVFEGLKGSHVVDFLQAEDIGVSVGDRKGRHLPRVVGRGNHPRLLELLIDALARHLEKLDDPVLAQLVSEAGEIETGEKIFDIEGGEAKRHGKDPVAAVP